MNLSALSVGDRAIIKGYQISESASDHTEGRQSNTLIVRMMEMGLTINTEIQVEHEAPFGGAIAVRCRGGLIALRRSDAVLIEVTKC